MSAEPQREADASPAEPTVDEETKETVRELVSMVNRLESKVDELEETVEQKDERIDELETAAEARDRYIHQLTSQVENNGQKIGAKVGRVAFSHAVEQLTAAEIDNYNADPMQHRDHFADFNRRFNKTEKTAKRLDSIAQEQKTLSGDPVEENWQKVIEKAQNLAGHRDHKLANNRVKLYKKQISSATGLGERRASQLIEEWGQDVDEDERGKAKRGTDWQKYKHITTSRKTESSGIQKKALIVDLDVWGDDDE